MHLVSAPSVLEESGEKCIYIETQTLHEKLFSWDTFFFCHLYTIFLSEVTLSQSFTWKHYRWESNSFKGFWWYTATHPNTDHGGNCSVIISAKSQKALSMLLWNTNLTVDFKPRSRKTALEISVSLALHSKIKLSYNNCSVFTYAVV